PIELAGLDHDTADRVAVAGEELGGRVYDDVRAPLDRAAEVGRRERVIDDERDTGVVGDLCDGLEIDDDAARIGETFDEDRLALLGQRALEVFRIARIDEVAGPAELLEREAELGERAAIEIARGDKFITRAHQREEGDELRCMPGRRS